MKGNWIWLNSHDYCELQRAGYTFNNQGQYLFAVADFKKKIKFSQKIVSARIKASAGVKFILYINKAFVGRGPVESGGDYDLAGKMPEHYYNIYDIKVNSDTFDVFSRVYNNPVAYSDIGIGHGGFFFEAELILEDGTKKEIVSDDSWQVKLNEAYISADEFDSEKGEGEYKNAEKFIPDINKFIPSPIPNLSEEAVPFSIRKINGKTEIIFEKVYCGFLCFDLKTNKKTQLDIEYREIEINDKPQKIITDKNMSWRSLTMKSCDRIILSCSNPDAEIENIKFIFTHYPCDDSLSDFDCSEDIFNRLFRLAKHTLKLCRQSIHLDSPMHQEPLACTGDYYIESLMNYYTFGDPRLTRLDLIRTASLIEMNGGYMFHTTYSMLWISMLYDYYMYTGDKSIFKDTLPALHMLLQRFSRYIGDNGLIEKARNYMFMDWMVLDGYSLHHPPKAMGQTVLCAFYYGGLKTAEKIYEICGKEEEKNIVKTRAENLRDAMNRLLFDKEKNLYISGLGTKDLVSNYNYLPENIDKVYYTKHANILCALYGVCDKENEKNIIEKVLNDKELTDYQPYFAHFVIDAVYKAGLFGKYGMKILMRWKTVVEDSEKGLAEGWHKPEETYCFDHSHAWGGTPAYQMPNKLLGIEILEAGMKKIRISPQLLNLSYLNVSFPTVMGKVSISVKKGEEPVISAPDGMCVIYDK